MYLLSPYFLPQFTLTKKPHIISNEYLIIFLSEKKCEWIRTLVHFLK